MLFRDIISKELNTNIKIKQLYYSLNNSVSRDIGVSQLPNPIIVSNSKTYNTGYYISILG